jgi:hypothetical protein
MPIGATGRSPLIEIREEFWEDLAKPGKGDFHAI